MDETHSGSSVDQWFYAEGGARNGPVSSDELSALLRSGRIDDTTAVWRQGFADWMPLRNSGASCVQGLPPSLKAKDINNWWVWLLALGPMFAWLITSNIDGLRPGSSAFQGLGLLMFIYNTVISACDERALKKAGHKTTQVWIGALFVPVYLFIRASRVRQTPWYGWVWILFFIVWVLAASAKGTTGV
jgi:hypothetical protein